MKLLWRMKKAQMKTNWPDNRHLWFLLSLQISSVYQYVLSVIKKKYTRCQNDTQAEIQDISNYIQWHDVLKNTVRRHTEVWESTVYDEAQRLVGKTILDPSWKAHAAECEHGPEMWWAFQRLYVCGTWSLTRLGKIGCGHGLGNGSAPVSEFYQEPLDFIEVYDQNTHKKGEFGKGQKPTFMLKHCLFPCSLLCHMLALIFLFTCHTCCWCFYCDFSDFCVSLFKKAVESQGYREFRVRPSGKTCSECCR